MNRRVLAIAALLVAAAAVLLLPRGPMLSSLALFTDDTTAAGTVTGGSCASTTTWSTLAGGLASSGAREQWQRLGTTGSSLPNDTYASEAWTSTSVTTDQDGALYCSTDRAALLGTTASSAVSSQRTYTAWGATGTQTVAVWLKGTSSSAGRVWSLAEGASGASTYAERALWITAGGDAAFGTRYGSAASSAWTLTTSGLSLADGRWHLVVVEMTAGSSPAAAIVIDGIEQTTTSTGTAGYRATSSSSTNARFYLGANAAGRAPTGAPTAAWTGTYDEFLVLGAALTTAQRGAGAGSLVRASES